MTKKIEEKPVMREIPLHGSPELIKVMTIRKKFVDQMQHFSEREFKELRMNPPLDAVNQPMKNVRLIGLCLGAVIFDYTTGDPTKRKLAKVGQVDAYRVYAQEEYVVEGIEWPLSDEAKEKVEEIDQKWWDFIEVLPQLFET